MPSNWRDNLPSTKRRLRTPQVHKPVPVDYRPVAANVLVLSPEPGKWVVVAKGKQKTFTSREHAREYARTRL